MSESLPPDLVHPSLAPYADRLVRNSSVDDYELPLPQKLVAEAIIALLNSRRMNDELRGYVETLNAALDHKQTDPILTRLLHARDSAMRVAAAQSGMACENALMSLWSDLDELRELLQKP